MARMNIKDLDNNITPEEMKELNAASKLKPVFDEDSPEMTAEMLKQFKRVNNNMRKKQAVSHLKCRNRPTLV